jgi:alkylmercury lyase
MPTLPELTEALVAKWSTASGAELIAEGAKIVQHLMTRGPLPAPLADAMLGRPEGMLQYFDDRHYGLELDDAGRIVGAGLSLIPSTPHTVRIGDHDYTGWCVMDCVMFPVIFGGESTVTTSCPTTGTPISFTVTPDGIRDLTPAEAWFSLAPVTGGDIREVFCDRVNLYRDRATAEAAVAADPDLAAGPAAECWTIARRLADLF